MNSFIRLFVVILALAVLLSSAACVEKPVASDPIKPVNVSSTEPPVTKAPDPAEMPTPEETLALANYAAAMELPAIRGHYLINDDGAMYDLLTGRFIVHGVKVFIPCWETAINFNNVNLVIRDDGELMGWHESEPEINYGELMDMEYHPEPIHLMDHVINAAPGCAINDKGQLILWGGVQMPGEWEEMTAEQQAELMEPRIIDGVVDVDGWCALLANGTLARIDHFSIGLTDNPEFVASDVKALYPLCNYLTSDGTLHVNTLAIPNVEKVYWDSFFQCSYYIDTAGTLHRVYGSMDTSDRPALLENVETIFFDNCETEMIADSYFYLFAKTKGGELWCADEYTLENPYPICSGVKDVCSDGVNTYILMDDASLWAYTAAVNSVYTEQRTERHNEDYTLVKVMEDVACCGATIAIDETDRESACIRSTFYACTNDCRVFEWGYVNGNTVSDPQEVFLKK